MNDEADYSLSVERAFICCGLAMAVLFTLGVWTLAGFIPPPAPSTSAAEISMQFARKANGIIGGSLLVLIAAGMFIPFSIAVSAAMERHAPRGLPLSRAQLMGGTINVLFFSMIGLLWMVAAFRFDGQPTEVRLLNDMAWLIMVVPTMPFIIQAVSIAVVALAETHPRSELPRWVGYFNLWCALLVVPGMLSGFFKTGLIAWNGLLSFWLEVVAFLLWLVVMVFVLIKALPSKSCRG